MDLQKNLLQPGNNPALIVVDMINGFTDPRCKLGSECEGVVTSIKILLQAFRAHELPVFFTTVIYHDASQAPVFRKKIPALNELSPGSRWVEVDPQLEPAAGEPVIEKQWASSFFRTNLAALLQERNVDSVVVTGLTTSGCVRATAIDALQHDLVVYVPEEAVGDRNQDAHRANLFDINAKYGEVVSMDTVLNYLDSLD